jgi:hypothetical protein
MRWKLKDEPYDGAVRVVRIFAWRPHVVNGHKVWLEGYNEIQEYQKPFYAKGWWTVRRRELDEYNDGPHG